MTPEERDEYVRKLREEKRLKRKASATAYYQRTLKERKEYNTQYRNKNRERLNANHRQWSKEYREKHPNFSSEVYRKNKDWHRTYDLYKNYKLTPQDYDAMLATQGGRCAVPTCRADKPGGNRKYFCVDHDHDTGAVRGLTCYKCNIILHNGRDNKEFLLGLIEYLEKAR